MKRGRLPFAGMMMIFAGSLLLAAWPAEAPAPKKKIILSVARFEPDTAFHHPQPCRTGPPSS